MSPADRYLMWGFVKGEEEMRELRLFVQKKFKKATSWYQFLLKFGDNSELLKIKRLDIKSR